MIQSTHFALVDEMLASFCSLKVFLPASAGKLKSVAVYKAGLLHPMFPIIVNDVALHLHDCIDHSTSHLSPYHSHREL
jgi:hypothetical protein